MNQDSNQTVILLIVKDDEILLEQRALNSALAGHFLPPGGKIEINEIKNPADACKREAMEELGIKLTEFSYLEDIQGETGRLLKPFVITKWEGEIPEKILDKGNPLFWVKIDEFSKSPLPSIRDFSKLIRNYLNKNL